MGAIEARRLSYRYGGVEALDDVSFDVPAGAVYALLGPNGSGKTTLLQILSGLRRAKSGDAQVLGRDVRRLIAEDRIEIAYLAEGQPLPEWMRLEQLESYLAPLYPTWDPTLAAELRTRFRLDPRRRIGGLSRGEHMKAAMLCTLAARPRVVLMDEPFTGMDVVVKDQIVEGLLETASTEGWTIMLASHDIAELEVLADWVGILDDGHMLLSEPMESVRSRFKRVEVIVAADSAVAPAPEWIGVRRSGARVEFLSAHGDDLMIEAEIRASCPSMTRYDVTTASLRDVFASVTGGTLTPVQAQAVTRGEATSTVSANR